MVSGLLIVKIAHTSWDCSKNGENINEKEFFLAKIYKKTQNVCVITKIVLPLQHYKWLSEVLQL